MTLSILNAIVTYKSLGIIDICTRGLKSKQLIGGHC